MNAALNLMFEWIGAALASMYVGNFPCDDIA